MNKNVGIIVVIALIVIVGGVYASMKINKEEVMIDEKTDDSSIMEKKTDNVVKDEIVEGNDMKKNELAVKGTYEAYSSEKITRAEKGDVVIFFHASWCPSCRGLDADIGSNINSIPAGISILKADYDRENELKKKYGVTSQHTLVQVDKDGNLIKKWSGGSKLSNVLSEVN